MFYPFTEVCLLGNVAVRTQKRLALRRVDKLEIALKRVRSDFDFLIEDDWDVLIPEGLREAGTLEIGLEASDCRFMEDLPLHHRDPFDRLMISQALRRQIGVLSRDDQWDAYGLKRVW